MTSDKYVVTSVGSNWCIVNTRTHRKRIMGRAKLTGVNYYDKAKEEAAKRMGCKTSEVEYIPNYFEKIKI